jgi:dihydrofolate reductase
MRRLIVDEWMGLDGVVQAPAAADEDTSGGFAHGGWAVPYFDEASMRWVIEGVSGAGGYVLGRRTYEIFAGYWPTAPEEQQVLAAPLNTRTKHVASRTLSEPLGWRNSTVLRGDLADAVRALKEQDGADLHVIGSTELVPTLIGNDLVDELRVMIDPVILGGGKRIFADDGALRTLRLLRSEVTSTGAILAAYAPATR